MNTDDHLYTASTWFLIGWGVTMSVALIVVSICYGRIYRDDSGDPKYTIFQNHIYRLESVE